VYLNDLASIPSFVKKSIKYFEFRNLTNTQKKIHTWKNNYGFQYKRFLIRTRKVLVIRVWRFFTAAVLKILFKEINCLVKDPFRKLTTHSLGKNP